MPGFGKVRLCKHIQLKRVAGSEDQMIEIADLLKEVSNVVLIREVKRVTFCFFIERSNGVFLSRASPVHEKKAVGMTSVVPFGFSRI